MDAFSRVSSAGKSFRIFPLVFVVVYLIAVTESKRYHSIAGPFRIVIKRITNCPSELQAKQKIDFVLKDTRTRYDQDLTFTGNLSLPFVLTDRMSASMLLASWNNVAGWKDNAHIFHVDKICREMDRFIPTIWHALNNNVYGEMRPCPIEPGLFRFQNWTIAWRDIPVKHFFYNRWRADLNIVYPNKEIAGCIRAEADTLPK